MQRLKFTLHNVLFMLQPVLSIMQRLKRTLDILKSVMQHL